MRRESGEKRGWEIGGGGSKKHKKRQGKERVSFKKEAKGGMQLCLGVPCC